MSTNVRVPYYSSFQYIRDRQNGIGPPPADQGGPTVYEMLEHEGMVDKDGYFTSGRGGHMGTWSNPTTPSTLQELTDQTLNWGLAQEGQTVGGIGNTDGWGDPINWGKPQGRAYEAGEVFSTPAGDYNVIKNPWGQFALEPIGEASTSGGPYFNNMTHGGHHMGINYETGEAWYQTADGQPVNVITNNAQQAAPAGALQDTQARTASNTQASAQQQQALAGVSVPAALKETASGMLTGAKSGNNPEWNDLVNSVNSQGMGPFMLGQIAKRR